MFSSVAETLATYPYVVVRIGCRLCKRSGSYRLARLAAKYGAEIEPEALMEELAFDCLYRPSKRKPRKYEANCEALSSILWTQTRCRRTCRLQWHGCASSQGR